MSDRLDLPPLASRPWTPSARRSQNRSMTHRRALEPTPAQPVVTDARILRVLASLNQQFAERWSLKRMAKVAGMSRAAFVRRFVVQTGSAPLAHLTRLRMVVAEALLADSEDPAVVIAPQ